MIQKNAISWFEIPATDLKRAQTFYENVLDISMASVDLDDLQMRLFPTEDQSGVGGAICYSKTFYKVSKTDGALIYLNAGPDLQTALAKVEKEGGKILIPKTQITPEYGYMAVFTDTEGNRVAFHSME